MLKLRYSLNRSFHSTMSKPLKRNNNIQPLSLIRQLHQAPVNCFLENDNYSREQERCFGELIEKDHSPPYYKPKLNSRKEVFSPPFFKTKLAPKNQARINDDVDTESIISGISEIQLIKSLSSSPSWSDDNDIDGCRRVQDELAQMDRVLRGIDPIPLNYDVDEYKQWMETFPTLSLFDKKEYGPYKIWKTNKKDTLSTKKHPKDKDSSIKKVPCANLQQYKKEIKKAVIHNIYENISIRLNKGSEAPSTSDFKPEKLQIGDVTKTQMYLSRCLTTSPFDEIVKGKYPTQGFLTRHNSREDEKCSSPSFESLPIMLENSSMNTIRPMNKYRNDLTKGVNMKKSRRSIVLPPIENKWSQNPTLIRSISATPSYSPLLSAKTMKLDSKLLSGKSRNIPHF